MDISDTSLKFVQLAAASNHFELKAYGERDITKGVVEAGVIKNSKKLTSILKEAMVKSDLSRHVVVSIPGEEIFLSKIKLPLMLPDELKGAVRVEAEAHIPINLRDAYLDYRVIDSPDGGDHLNVLIAASRRLTIDSYLDVLNGAGLTTLSIEPESTAIARAVIKAAVSNGAHRFKRGTAKDGGSPKTVARASNLPRPYEQGEPVLIIEIGANRTRLIIYAQNSVVVVGSVAYSATDGAIAISKSLKVDIAKAHRLQWSVGLGNDKKYGVKIKSALTPLLKKFSEEIKKYVSFFNARHAKEGFGNEKIRSILLSGGGSRMPQIDEYLSASLKLTVARANPWVNIGPDSPDKRASRGGPSSRLGRGGLRVNQSLRYTTAIGLGLRGVRRDIGEIFE